MELKRNGSAWFPWFTAIKEGASRNQKILSQPSTTISSALWYFEAKYQHTIWFFFHFTQNKLWRSIFFYGLTSTYQDNSWDVSTSFHPLLFRRRFQLQRMNLLQRHWTKSYDLGFADWRISGRSRERKCSINRIRECSLCGIHRLLHVGIFYQTEKLKIKNG